MINILQVSLYHLETNTHVIYPNQYTILILIQRGNGTKVICKNMYFNI